MPRAPQVRVTLSRDLIRNINELPARLRDDLKSVVIITALVDIETKAKLKVRVDTGRLRASINTRYGSTNQVYNYSDDQGQSFNGALRERPKDTPTQFQCIVGTNVDYAMKIEERYAYLEPQYIRARPKLKRDLADVIRRYRPRR